MGYLDGIFARIGMARFAARLMRTIREAGETDELRFEPAENRIIQVRAGEPVGVINLANLYGNYRRTPRARRPDLLDLFVRTAMTRRRVPPADIDAASPDLRPRIWARWGLEQQRLRKRLDDPGGADLDAPHERIGEHLQALLAYDWPDSVQSITAENLAGWGVTFCEAMEVAGQNLAEATQGYAQIGENLYAFASGDSYDVSRLTLIDRIQDFALAGKPVAMVPNPEVLYLTGSEDEVGLAMIAELASQDLNERTRSAASRSTWTSVPGRTGCRRRTIRCTGGSGRSRRTGSARSRPSRSNSWMRSTDGGGRPLRRDLLGGPEGGRRDRELLRLGRGR
jgi:hypothetical protein